jgi:hypothetical protein
VAFGFLIPVTASDLIQFCSVRGAGKVLVFFFFLACCTSYMSFFLMLFVSLCFNFGTLSIGFFVVGFPNCSYHRVVR